MHLQLVSLDPKSHRMALFDEIFCHIAKFINYRFGAKSRELATLRKRDFCFDLAKIEKSEKSRENSIRSRFFGVGK